MSRSSYEKLGYHRIQDRSFESLIGICRGILADQQLNEAEVRFLELWLRDHAPLSDNWPGSQIHRRVSEILADGIVTKEELADLGEVLGRLIGGSLEETGAADGVATSLPLDENVDVLFEGCKFCFTGSFVFGPRSSCERVTSALGATVVDTVTNSLDYLVVGAAASKSWAHSSFGRKIEQAVALRDAGKGIAILAEKDWVVALNRAARSD